MLSDNLELVRKKNEVSKSSYSILFVCEGTVTEPVYFQELEKYLNSNFANIYPDGIKFIIYPFPPEHKDVINNETLFTRKKQKLNFQVPSKEINGEIEEKYYAEPIRWVRLAQIIGQEGCYDEMWAIFDYDNRSEKLLSDAFELAVNNAGEKKVKIAFSSYSFEYWILLHYQLYQLNLTKSECKDSNGKEIGCCRIIGLENCCDGEICLGGYLRKNNFEAGYFNKTNNVDYLKSLNKNLKTAVYNALYIENLEKNIVLEPWQIKPFTSVHKIILSLTRNLNYIHWNYNNNKITSAYLDIEINFKSEKFTLHFKPNNKKTILIDSDNINFLNINYKRLAKNDYFKEYFKINENDLKIEIKINKFNKASFFEIILETEKYICPIFFDIKN